MKKYIILGALLFISVVGFAGVRLYRKSLQDTTAVESESTVKNDTRDAVPYEDEEGNQYELIESIADCVAFEYEALKDRADVIALVKVSDSLSQADAYITYDESGEYIFDYYQSREVEVIAYYKNSMDNEKTLKVIEPCAVHQNQLLTIEGYAPLCKGQTYLLFLDYREKEKMYSLISAGTSVVPMEALQEADNLDIAYKAILDFGESTMPVADKKEILSQDEVKHDKSVAGNDVLITLETYTFHCNYLDSQEGCYLTVEK